jgi:hypothetical protein
VRPQRSRESRGGAPPGQSPREGEENRASSDLTPAGHQVIRPSSPSRPWVVSERVRLRKPHPCGTSDWRITRVGADIGITCEGCGHRVMLPRDEFNRRVKTALDGPPGR